MLFAMKTYIGSGRDSAGTTKHCRCPGNEEGNKVQLCYVIGLKKEHDERNS